MPELPQDVLEVIADASSDDEAALRTLSLVSQLFVRPCQRHLFEQITISPPPLPQEIYDTSTPKVLANLLSILHQNHRIRTYVHRIHFIQQDRQGSPTAGVGNWLYSHGDVAANILDLLSSSPISGLSIIYPRMELSAPWDRLSLSFRQALYRVFERPGFYELALIKISTAPPSISTRFPNIRRIVLDVIAFGKPFVKVPVAIGQEGGQSQERVSSEFRDLVFGYHPSYYGSSISWVDPAASLDLKGLRSLTLALPETPVHDIKPLFKLGYLKRLHIYFRYHPYLFTSDPTSWNIDFSGLASLEDLTFSGVPGLQTQSQHPKRYISSWAKEVTTMSKTISPLQPLKRLKVAVVPEMVDWDPLGFLDDVGETLKDISGSLGLVHASFGGSLGEVVFTVEVSPSLILTAEFEVKVKSLVTWVGCEDVLRVEVVYRSRLPWELCLS